MSEKPILFSGAMVRALLDDSKTQTRRVVKPQPIYGDVAGTFASWMFKKRRGSGHWLYPNARETILAECPYGQPGDRLWVRETFAEVHPIAVTADRFSIEGRAGIPGPPKVAYRVVYRADGDYPPVHSLGTTEYPYRRIEPFSEDGMNSFAEHHGWTPSIHMPRWASRIFLEVTDVRVERLQAMEGQAAFESDALKEGIHRIDHGRGGYGYHAFRNEPHPNNWNDPCDAFRDLWNSLNSERGYGWDVNPWVWVVSFKRVTP